MQFRLLWSTGVTFGLLYRRPAPVTADSVAAAAGAVARITGGVVGNGMARLLPLAGPLRSVVLPGSS